MDEERTQVRVPTLAIGPSVGFPPVECRRGISPNYAAESRPRVNMPVTDCGDDAVAIIGPMPWTVAARRQSGDWSAHSVRSRVTWAISPSSASQR